MRVPRTADFAKRAASAAASPAKSCCKFNVLTENRRCRRNSGEIRRNSMFRARSREPFSHGALRPEFLAPESVAATTTTSPRLIDRLLTCRIRRPLRSRPSRRSHRLDRERRLEPPGACARIVNGDQERRGAIRAAPVTDVSRASPSFVRPTRFKRRARSPSTPPPWYALF